MIFALILLAVIIMAIVIVFTSDKKENDNVVRDQSDIHNINQPATSISIVRDEFYENHLKENEKNRTIIAENISRFDKEYISIHSVRIFVTGIFYRSESAKIEARSAIAGDPVKLAHDKNNMYDDFAVKIKYNNYVIGYVPKDQSREVLQAMWKYEYKAIMIHSYETYNFTHYDYDTEVIIKVYFLKERSTTFLIGKNVAICGEFERYKPATIQRIVQDSGGKLYNIVTKNVDIVIMGKEKRSDRKRKIQSWIEEGVEIRMIEEDELLKLLGKKQKY